VRGPEASVRVRRWPVFSNGHVTVSPFFSEIPRGRRRLPGLTARELDQRHVDRRRRVSESSVLSFDHAGHSKPTLYEPVVARFVAFTRTTYVPVIGSVKFA
jgi:hypothetical protein